MQSNNKSILNSNLNVEQLKLFDFGGDEPAPFTHVKRTLGYVSNLEINSDTVVLDENDVFKYVNPICPKCGSKYLKNNGVKSKKKLNDRGLSFNFKVQLYKCKECGRNFTTEVKSLLMENKHFVEGIRSLIPSLLSEGYESLRKTAKKIEISLGIKISHQSVRNWIVEYVKDQNIEINEEKSLIKNKSAPYSGYYVYDEEYLKINGKKHYRLTL